MNRYSATINNTQCGLIHKVDLSCFTLEEAKELVKRIADAIAPDTHIFGPKLTREGP